MNSTRTVVLAAAGAHFVRTHAPPVARNSEDPLKNCWKKNEFGKRRLKAVVAAIGLCHYPNRNVFRDKTRTPGDRRSNQRVDVEC